MNNDMEMPPYPNHKIHQTNFNLNVILRGEKNHYNQPYIASDSNES